MGDRSYLSLTFGSIHSDEREAIDQFVEEEGLELDSHDGGYFHEEVYLGTDEEYHGRLKEIAPKSSWRVGQDPRYELPGWVYYYDPELGEFDAQQDGHGQLIFTVPYILNAIAGMPTEQEIERRLGVPWVKRLG